MNNNWILNASPLIVLGKANLLETISPISKLWLIPTGVIEEISKKSIADYYIKQLACKSTVEIKTIENIVNSLRN